jgi:hypothetical protein
MFSLKRWWRREVRADRRPTENAGERSRVLGADPSSCAYFGSRDLADGQSMTEMMN